MYYFVLLYIIPIYKFTVFLYFLQHYLSFSVVYDSNLSCMLLIHVKNSNPFH